MPFLESDALDWVDYDERTRVLRAIFRENGRAYRYFDVPKHLFEELLAADSEGGFFNARIRPCFNYEEIDRSEIKLPLRPRKPRRTPSSSRPAL